VGYFTILLIGFLLWIAYGAAAGILALVIPNTVALLVGAAAVVVALRLRRRPAGNHRHRLTTGHSDRNAECCGLSSHSHTPTGFTHLPR